MTTAPTRSVPPLERAIQSVIIFSTVLGALFLVQANGVLPAFVFEFVAFGWVLFAVDSVLTFFAPKPSYAMGMVIGVLALAASLPDSAHYAFIANGDFLPAATFLLGSVSQVLLVVLTVSYFVRSRSRPP